MNRDATSDVAAQIAYPSRQCIAFIGDGGMSMLMGELAYAQSEEVDGNGYR